MYTGKERFDFFLQQLGDGIQQASLSKNPARWMYQQKIRTPLFMLEGLCRLHANIHHPNKFSRLKKKFKILEDGIGEIDFYDNAFIELQAHTKIPAYARQYLKAKTEEKVKQLNHVLKEDKWIKTEVDRLQKIRMKIISIKWLPEEAEVLKIEEAYRKTIKEVKQFVASGDFHFNNMEEDVHELRRKLRWLSIYAHALRGVVQLAALKKPSSKVRTYHTETVLRSPFNQLPSPAANGCFLLLDQNYFLALSWIIEKLGQLKDEGLLILAVKEAIQQKEDSQEQDAIKKACKLLGKRTNHLHILLQEASKTSNTFFQDGILDQLVIGVVQPLMGRNKKGI